MKLSTLFEKPIVVNGNKPEQFVDYLRSKNEIKDALSKHYNSFNLIDIIKLFSEHNMVIVDSVVLDINPEALYPFREYDRSPNPHLSGWTGKLSGEEYDRLKADIKKNGIKHPLTLRLERMSNGDVDVRVGEGNHRLRIARELDIPVVPVQFYYIK